MSESRLSEIDALKGLAIIGVLVLHSSFEGRLGAAFIETSTLLQRLFDWSVLAFFFASGALFKNKENTQQQALQLSLKLGVPFVIYNLLYNLSFLLLNQTGVIETEFEMTGAQLALMPFLSPAFQLYFLPYLLLISLLFLYSPKLMRKIPLSTISSAAIVLTLICYSLLQFPGKSHGEALLKLPLYFSAFCLGYLYRQNRDKRLIRVAGLVLSFTAFVSYFVFKIPLCLLSLAMPWALSELFFSLKHFNIIQPFGYFGKASGSIYLWHTPLLLPFLSTLFFKLGLQAWPLYLATLITGLGLCLAMRAALDKFSFPLKSYVTL